MKKCTVCAREAREGSKFCRNHQVAHDALRKGYAAWEKAYGGMSWKDYLRRVKGSGETGQWVKDVASFYEDREGEEGGR